jgi:hypothetical protein
MLHQKHMREWSKLRLTPERIKELNQLLIDQSHANIDPPWED